MKMLQIVFYYELGIVIVVEYFHPPAIIQLNLAQLSVDWFLFQVMFICNAPNLVWTSS